MVVNEVKVRFGDLLASESLNNVHFNEETAMQYAFCGEHAQLCIRLPKGVNIDEG
jgi:hypothetical protein